MVDIQADEFGDVDLRYEALCFRVSREFDFIDQVLQILDRKPLRNSSCVEQTEIS